MDDTSIGTSDSLSSVEGHGWEEVCANVEADPSEVPELLAVRDLERVHAPLANLVGRYPSDFMVRAAALYCLQNSDDAYMSPDMRDAALWWLPQRVRDTTLRNLQDGGWIVFRDEGWVFTQVGHDLYQLVELIFHLGKSDGPNFGGVILRALKQLSGDPYYALRGLLKQVRGLEYSLEQARASQSSVIMDGTVRHCREARSTIQVVLKEVAVYLDDPKAIQVIHALHRANARMMVALGQLEDALAQVMGQHVVLPHGYSPHQITESLMSMPIEALVDTAKAALQPLAPGRSVVREEMVAYGAANYLDRERPPGVQRPIKAIEARENRAFKMPPDSRVEEFLSELENLDADEISLEDILHGAPNEILMRFAVMPFLAQDEDGTSESMRLTKLGWEYCPGTKTKIVDQGRLRIIPDATLRRRKR